MTTLNTKAFAAVCLSLAGALVGCTGDDSSVGTNTDGGAVESDGAATNDAAEGDAQTADASTSDATTADAGAIDSSSPDSAFADSGAPADSGAQDSGDGASEADGKASDAGDAAAALDGKAADAADALAEDAADAASVEQPALCTLLDTAWQLTPDAAAEVAMCATQSPVACPDRADNWANDIVVNQFVSIFGSDCRLTNFAGAITNPTGYVNTLIGWTEAFLGCPDPSQFDSGSIGYALIPAELSGHVFTQADLNALSQDWLLAIEASSSQDAPVPLNLNATQIAQLQALLAQLQATVGGTIASTTIYSYGSSCVDAGPDSGASDASGD